MGTRNPRRWLALGGLALLAGAAGLAWWAGTDSSAPAGAAGDHAPARAADRAGVDLVAPLAEEEEVQRAAGRGRHSLELRLVDFHTSAPLPDAVFHARFDEALRRADDEGVVRYPAEELEPFEFEATAPGYCVTRGALDPVRDPAAGARAVPLVRATLIQGRVFDDLGEPVPRAIVTAFVPPDRADAAEPVPDGYPPGWTLAAEATGARLSAGEDGRFELLGVVPGSDRFSVRGWKSGHREHVVPVHAHVPGEPTLVNLTLGKKRKGDPSTGTVEGRVLLNGNPVPAAVTVFTDEWHDRDVVMEGERYSVSGVPAGEVRVLAHPAAWAAPEEWRTARSDRVLVAAGHTTRHDVELVMVLGTISGVVVKPTRGPRVGLVLARNAGLVVHGDIEADGSFSLEVPEEAGPYEVVAGSGRLLARVPNVPVGASGVELRLPEGAELMVRATSADSGASLRHVAVAVRPAGSDSRWEPQWRSHSAGSGSVYWMPEGDWDVRVSAQGFEEVVRSGVPTSGAAQAVVRVELRRL